MTLTQLPAPRTPNAMEAPPLRWGILGPGMIADQMVASLARYTKQVVRGVASRDLRRAQEFAGRWQIEHAYGSYEELVADPHIDAVYIATPHHLHLPHALLAIEAGKHVLIEKPVGLDAQQAQWIADAARREGVFCMEAMWTLFLPKFDVLRQLIHEGSLGQLHTVFADLGERFQPDHRVMDPDLAGGPMLDLGTYAVTLATWALGSDLDVAGAASTEAPNGTNGQFAATLMRPNGVAQVSSTILDDGPTTAFLGGTKASVWLERHWYRPGWFTVITPSGERLTWEEPRVDHDGLHFEVAEAARQIAAGEPESPLRPFADTIATMRVMDSIREAAGITFSPKLRHKP